MTSVTSERFGKSSPPKYRRKTLELFQPTDQYNDWSVPSRPASALDRRWVHRSLGDLTSHLHPQNSRPQHVPDFYEELYNKYPNTFRRRREQRTAGRKLFNSRPQVRFDEEVELFDDHGSMSSLHLAGKSKQATNWESEVGYYMNHNSRSRDCLTSAEPSESGGSVLSVTQRLRLNSFTLNKLLNEQSPLRKKIEKNSFQYDSGTENEQTLEDYFLHKSSSRSRSRKKHRKVLQRRIDNKENVADERVIQNGDSYQRWLSKSLSPNGRHIFSTSSPRSPPINQNHQRLSIAKKHVDVDSLMADSDLKIDTLLEQISLKMSSPDSPPDSAIDVNTPPSVQSEEKGHHSGQLYTVSQELPNMNDTDSNKVTTGCEDSESSPGSSVSVRYRDNVSTQECDINLVPSINTDKSISEDQLGSSHDDVCNIKDMKGEINTNSYSGLLQLYQNGLTYELPNGTECGESIANENVPKYANESFESSNQISDAISTVNNSDLNVQCGNKFSNNEAVKLMVNKGGELSTKTQHRITSPVENLHYQADDEQEDEGGEVVTVVTQGGPKKDQKLVSYRDSDVDSGIGHSSTDLKVLTSSLPPRGRCKQRGTTPQPTPVRADLSVLPLRSEVDTCILDEVNLEQLSHDLLVTKGSNSNKDETTDDTAGNTKPTKLPTDEQKLAEKYRRTRSPSPFVLKHRGQPSPIYRPNSAPSLLSDDLQLRVVEISLSTESLSDLSSTVSNGVSQPCSGAEQQTLSNVQQASCQNVNNSHQASSNTSLAKEHNVENSRNTGSYNNQNTDQDISILNHQSSRQGGIEHRKVSISSLSSIGSLGSEQFTESEPENPSSNSADTVKHRDNNTSDIVRVTKSPRPRQIKTIAGHSGVFNGIDQRNGDIMEANTKSEQNIHEKKGTYKPTMSSPRMKEKRLRIKNILKNKKGSFSPTEEMKTFPAEERTHVARIYAKDRQNGNDNLVSRDNPSKSGINTQSNAFQRKRDSLDSDKQSEISEKHPRGTTLQLQDNYEIDNARVIQHGRLTPYELASSLEQDRESVDNFINGANTDSNTFTAKPVTINQNQENEDCINTRTTQADTLPPGRREPPAKPARTKHKTLPADLNFSKYKIMPNSGQSASQSSLQSTEQDPHNGQSDSSVKSHDLNGSRDTTLMANSSKQRGRTPDPVTTSLPQNTGHVHMDNDIEVLPREKSNLQQSKALSASKSSLFGNIKTSTKGKFKALKKAISVDRGIDSCGVETHPGGEIQEPKGSHSVFPKMKKAPSLKSLTSLFSKKKKKKGKLSSEDTESSGTHGSTLSLSSGHSGHLNDTARVKWTSCHTLTSPVESSTHHQPIGKLIKVTTDGCQVIQLIKPQNGPIGFFIAKGSAKYRNGIFVSRFADERPERLFAGLLGVGDEIIEINGSFVRDLSQDAVYNLITASPIVVMKIFPFIARKDV